MTDCFRTRRRVEFHDTDMAGIVHFTAFFRYMESAEHELLRHLGVQVSSNQGGEHFSWPRISASCNFQSPARFEQVLDIEVRVAKLAERSVSYEFAFSHDGRSVAQGQMKCVFCRIGANGQPASTKIPASTAQKLNSMIHTA